MEWCKEMRTYLESNEEVSQHLQISIVFGDVLGFKCMIDSCYLIRKCAMNFEHATFDVDEFLAPSEWSRFGKCAKLEKIDLYWAEPFLLRIEHLQELLPIRKQLRVFKLHNVVTSNRTFDILKSWIYQNMPRLEHVDPLQNVTFISEDVRNSLSNFKYELELRLVPDLLL